MQTHKTRAMLRVEEERGEKLESILLRLLPDYNQKSIALELGIHPGTLSYWMIRLGIQRGYVYTNTSDRVDGGGNAKS